jgi:hypothetical protein
VGAPWFEGMENPTKPLTFMGIGNGGFLLRKVEDFLKVLYFPRNIKNRLLISSISYTGLAFVVQKNIHKVFFSITFNLFSHGYRKMHFGGYLFRILVIFLKSRMLSKPVNLHLRQNQNIFTNLTTKHFPLVVMPWNDMGSIFGEKP